MLSKYKLAKLKLLLLKYLPKARYLKISAIVAVSSATVIGFQNCSKTKFSAVEQASKAVISSAPTCINPFNGQVLQENESFTAWRRLSIPVGDGDICQSEKRVCVGGELTGSFQFSSCVKLNPSDCLLQGVRNGVREDVSVRHGQTVQVYSDSRVPFGGNCADQRHVRTCNNGVLSAPPYVQLACNPDPANNCNVTLIRNGVSEQRTIIHNQTFTPVFDSATVPHGGSCTPRTLSCNNGQVNGSARQLACTVEGAPIVNCTVSGLKRRGVLQPPQVLNHGASLTVYNRFLIPFGQGSCQAESISCNNGQVLGSSSRELECDTEQPQNCNITAITLLGPQSVTIPHGQTAAPYFAGFTVPNGQQCQAKTLTCNNGQVDRSERHTSCAPEAAPPRDCTVPLKENGVFKRNQTIRHGETYAPVFDSHSVPFNGQCIQKELSCNDGTVTGDARETACSVQAATFTPINVEGSSTTTEDPIKVFLIVDFSYSMQNELIKVKAAVDAFLEANKTRQAFDVYLYPVLGHTQQVQNTPVVGTATETLMAPLAQMQLRNNSNFAAAKADFMYRLQSQINLAANNTSEVNETGLCQIVRVLKQSNLYDANDKVAFIVVTDENDGSSVQPNGNHGGCTDKVVSNSYNTINVFGSSQGGQNLNVQGTYSGTRTSDGGQVVIPFNGDSFQHNISCGQSGQSCSGGVGTVATCTQALNEYLISSLSQGDVVVTQINSCQATVVNNSTSFLSNINVNNMRTLSQQYITQLDLDRIMAQQQGFLYNGTSYSSLNSFALSQWPARSPYTFNVQNQGFNTYQQHAEFVNSPNGEIFNHQLIMSLLNQKIPNPLNVVMDFVISYPDANPPGVTCGPNDQGLVGASYRDFAIRSGRPNQYKVESICQSTYNSALLHAGSLAVWTPRRDYTLTGLNATNSLGVHGVNIVNASGALIAHLAEGQYSLNQTTKVLSIPAPIELPEGSKIILLP